MVFRKCNATAASCMLILSVVFGLAKGMQPGRQLVRSASVNFIQSKAHVQKPVWAKVDRPIVVGYEDDKCTSELGGYLLPAQVKMNDGACHVAMYKDNEQQAALQKAGREMSMAWKCGNDSQSIVVGLHFGGNCSGGNDDTFRLTVAKTEFQGMAAGNCIKVMNRESKESEYMKLWMPENVLEYPACMIAAGKAENMWLAIYAAAGIFVFFVLCYLLLICYRRRHARRKKAKEQAMFGGMFGQWGPPPMMPGKGGKGPYDFGKGKGPPDFGKGMMGKQGSMKGKGKGKWDQGFPEVAAPPPPEPAPLDISVTVVGASNLRKADVTGSSDPFCEFGIAGKEKKYKTKVVKANVNPEWKQSERIKKFDEKEKLEFSIYDDDMGGAKRDLLGKATLKYKDLFPNGFDGELKLEEAGDAKEAKVKVNVEILAILKKEEGKEEKKK